MAALVDAIKVSPKLGPGGTAQPSCPISLSLLDSLTVHAKMSLIHSIVTHIMKLASSKTGKCRLHILYIDRLLKCDYAYLWSV